MGDADIIPLGTRGRPGRGSGRQKPSTSSRALAPPGQRQSRSEADEAAPREEDITQPVAVPAVDPPEASTDDLATEPVGSPGTATGEDGVEDSGPSTMPDGVDGTDEPAASPGPARERSGRPGFPLGELAAAATSAAEAVFGDDADRRLAELLALLRRRVTGDYAVDEY
ncbi:MAG: hypothetical protein QOK15_3881, partial [Nocardioidaceae bacterium]|nr:hypothetical protein [Nocardioidaceae bacterium]